MLFDLHLLLISLSMNFIPFEAFFIDNMPQSSQLKFAKMDRK